MKATNHISLIKKIMQVKNNLINSLLAIKIMNTKDSLKPYTVHYRNFQNIRLENCFYALDAFEARTLAMEFNKYIHEHPNSIDLIRCEQYI